MINTKHEGRLVCWLMKDENDDGTINGIGPEVIMRLTKENCALVNIGSSLPEGEKQQLREQLIKEIPDVFAFDLLEIGRTELVQYEVRTGEDDTSGTNAPHSN